jgi:hypothetical protein
MRIEKSPKPLQIQSCMGKGGKFSHTSKGTLGAFQSYRRGSFGGPFCCKPQKVENHFGEMGSEKKKKG